MESFLEENTTNLCLNKEPKIRKYTADNGPTRAAKHFTATWGTYINESTARRPKSGYLKS